MDHNNPIRVNTARVEELLKLTLCNDSWVLAVEVQTLRLEDVGANGDYDRSNFKALDPLNGLNSYVEVPNEAVDGLHSALG